MLTGLLGPAGVQFPPTTSTQRHVPPWILDGRAPPSRLAMRYCRTPDLKRVIGAWAMYEDVNNKFPLEKGWEILPSPSPCPYEICPIEGKGRGMVATRDIKCGELIICERPVLMVPAITFDETLRTRWKTSEEILLQLLYWLEQEDREKVVKLHNCKTLEECGPLVGILRTNAVHVAFDSDVMADYICVCLNISYCNHSCAPNAAYDSDKDTVIFTLRAEKDITKGEDITISYIAGTTMTLAERQAELQQKYRFACTCTLCSSPVDSAREDRRIFIEKTINSCVFMWNAFLFSPPRERKAKLQKDVETLENALRVMDEENMHDRRSEALQHIAFLYASQCDWKNFKKWGRKVVDWLGKVGVQGEGKTEKEKERACSSVEAAKMWEGWVVKPNSMPIWGAAK